MKKLAKDMITTNRSAIAVALFTLTATVCWLVSAITLIEEPAQPLAWLGLILGLSTQAILMTMMIEDSKSWNA